MNDGDDSLTGDPYTDGLVPVATRLVWAVRVGDADAVDTALDETVQAAGGPGLPALAVVLAAMCPDDRSPSELLAWRRNSGEYLRLRAAGVSAGHAAHLARRRGRGAA